MNPQPEPHILFTRDEIEATVKKLAGEISQDYHGKHPLLIGVLKGSFMFMADLIRHLDFPLEVEFITLSSYGRGRSTPGGIKVVQALRDVTIILVPMLMILLLVIFFPELILFLPRLFLPKFM